MWPLKTEKPYAGQPYTVDPERPIPAGAPRSMRMSESDADVLVGASRDAAAYYGGDVHFSFACPEPLRATFTLSHRGTPGIPNGGLLTVVWGDGTGSQFHFGDTIEHVYAAMPASTYRVFFTLDREGVPSAVPLPSVGRDWTLARTDLAPEGWS